MKYAVAKRTQHFTLPKQWASMRAAQGMEAATGRKVIHLEKGDYQGEEFRLPPHVAAAAYDGLRDGDVRYDPGPGLPELREAIAAEVSARGRPTLPEEVVVTAGAKHSLQIALLTLLDEGDGLIFPNPGYPPDEVWANYAGARVMHTPLIPGSWQYDLGSLARLLEGDDVKCLVINTPQRPNGELVTDIEEIARLVRPRRGLVTLSDEIFSHIVYDDKRHVSISAVAGMADRTILIDTFSKTYAMTGWRIGWTVAPAPLAQRFSMFLQDSITNVATFVQRAALAAMTGPQDWVEEKLMRLQRKRNAMVSGLNSIAGIRCPSPSGSFYVFADISQTGMSAEEFTRRLLHEQQIAVVAGTAFGSQGQGFVRLTFAVPDQDIERGVAGIAAMLGG